MSSGGSDICIHFLSFSEGREGRGGRGEKEGSGWGWLEGNKCKMKAFLEATKELYTGKGLGSPQWG